MSYTLAFLSEPGGPLSALKAWKYADVRFETLKMEDMVADPSGTIGAFLLNYFPKGRVPDASNYTFEKVSGRNVGGVDTASHYRSGQKDQWRKELPPHVISYVLAHFEPLLKRCYPEVFSFPEVHSSSQPPIATASDTRQ